MKTLELEENNRLENRVIQPLVPITEKKGKKKGFWKSLWKSKKLEKSNMVAVLYLRKNGHADSMEVESKNGFFNIDGKTYHENRDCVYTLGKERYPLAIIPEWNVTPLGRKEWEDKPMQEKFAILQDHVMKGIRHAERVRMGEKDGTKLNMKAIIMIGIAVLIVGAVLLGYK